MSAAELSRALALTVNDVTVNGAVTIDAPEFFKLPEDERDAALIAGVDGLKAELRRELDAWRAQNDEGGS